ncbi:hypothetical protein [Varibaculum vaginae]|uniref:hypothetical protein n=1 Tax=Varibaculum vaginae TaxID=2364797 RepID=UPI0011C4970C|nr:hypothetical protein [Varibaculum vaginae]
MGKNRNMANGYSFSRALVAAPLFIEGIDAVRNSDKHAQLAQYHLEVIEKNGFPPLTMSDVKTMAKVCGVTVTLLALRMATTRRSPLATCALILANGAATIVNGWQRDKIDTFRIAQGLALHAGLISEIFPRKQE